MLSDPEKVRFFFNSYAVAAIVVGLTLVIALLASYGFSRYNFPGKKVLNTIIISEMCIRDRFSAVRAILALDKADFFLVSRNDAAEQYERAEKFVAAVKKYLVR